PTGITGFVAGFPGLPKCAAERGGCVDKCIPRDVASASEMLSFTLHLELKRSLCAVSWTEKVVV
ncbi:MAG TPA: hypothetical protein VGJ91_19600, partial [Polyangiaceae bacterium]